VPIVRHNDCEMAGETDLDTALRLPLRLGSGQAAVAADCAVVAPDHAWYDGAAIRERARLAVDTRYVTEEKHLVAR